MAAAAADQDSLHREQARQQDPWAAQQYSLLDAPCSQMMNRNSAGSGHRVYSDDADDDSTIQTPPGGQDVHNWTMEGANASPSPHELLDTSLKMLFRSQEKIVDLKRMINHLIEADAVLHPGETAGGVDAINEKWQPLQLHHAPVQMRQQPPARQRQQQQPDFNSPPQLVGRGSGNLIKENEELKAVNKQWHEFWSNQKARQERLNENWERQLSELRNQLAQARQCQRQLPPPPQDPTESLISDTTEAMRRLERERCRLADDLARANNELEGLKQENEVLQAQVTLYKEDFERERTDRESAQARLAELREQLRISGTGVPAPPPPAMPAAAAAGPLPANRQSALQQRQIQQQQRMLAPTLGQQNIIQSGSAIYDILPDSIAIGKPPALPPPAVWQCRHCTLENPAGALHCAVCDKAKPQPAENPYLG